MPKDIVIDVIKLKVFSGEYRFAIASTPIKLKALAAPIIVLALRAMAKSLVKIKVNIANTQITNAANSYSFDRKLI